MEPTSTSLIGVLDYEPTMGALRRIKRNARKIPLVWPLLRPIYRHISMRIRVDNIAMFHTGRCGSSVLGSLLDQHHKMFWASEIFESLDPRCQALLDRQDGVRRVLVDSMYSRAAKCYGFETKFLSSQHLTPDRIDLTLEEYLSLLRGLGFSHFIVLRRKNLLRSLISTLIGLETKKWQNREDSAPVHSIAMDVDTLFGEGSSSLLSYFRHVETGHGALRELLRGDEVLFLSYEDDILDDPITAYQKVCSFIGMQPMSPEIEFKRQNPFSLRQLVTNFEEVALVLRKTGYEWMLDD